MIIANKFLNIIFPPQCLICKNIVSENGTLCLDCWQQIRFISDPICEKCGTSFEYDMGNNALCAGCIHDEPKYTRARAAFCYDEHSHKLITRLKYSDQTQLAITYSNWLINAGKEFIEVSDIVTPVPLHYLRFIGRRFNQSALLASNLASKTNISYLPDLLKRKRYTKPQTGLTKKQREKNVRNAFLVNEHYIKSVKNKNILLIDDVFTTGSTINQCSKSLLKAGASQVNVLTLARTIK
ncbi:MAG: ComF family protein [Rickettsiales bacterium]